jgi:hypothetical protein
MSNLAHLIAAALPGTFALGQITPDNDDDSDLPDATSKALFAKATTKKRHNSALPPRSRHIGTDAELAQAPPAARRKIEKPGVTSAQGASYESGWVTLQADPTKTGLHTQGRWQADVEIATNAARVLLAQILPTRVERSAQEFDTSATQAVVYENMWIDILLHQIESPGTNLCALSMLELAAYRIVNGEVKQIKSVKSSPMPMEMISVFTLGYRLKNGTISIDICSEVDRQTTTNIEVKNFCETLPIIKLRSGRALPNGIFRAKYRQIVSWSV